MGSKELQYIAQLESKIDLLETELTELDSALRSIGFVDGIADLKQSILDLTLLTGTDSPSVDSF